MRTGSGSVRTAFKDEAVARLLPPESAVIKAAAQKLCMSVDAPERCCSAYPVRGGSGFRTLENNNSSVLLHEKMRLAI